MKGGVVLLLLLLVACAVQPPQEGQSSQLSRPTAQQPLVEVRGTMAVRTGGERLYTKEQIVFNASDNTRLVANYYDAPTRNGLILLHQFNLNKESWDAFARAAQRKGYASIAVDLRGHGESEGELEKFTPRDFQAMLLDAQAAASQLRQRNKSVITILGASIGANTAFRYSSLENVPAILLSPGLEYKGIDINDVTSTAPTLIIVGKGDSYSDASSRELNENNLLGEHELLEVESAKHGTFLLDEPGVTERIFTFLDAQRTKS